MRLTNPFFMEIHIPFANPFNILSNGNSDASYKSFPYGNPLTIYKSFQYIGNGNPDAFLPIPSMHNMYVMEIHTLLTNPFYISCNKNSDAFYMEIHIPLQIPSILHVMEIQMLHTNSFYTLCNRNPYPLYPSLLYNMFLKSRLSVPIPSIYYVIEIQLIFTNPFFTSCNWMLFLNPFFTSCN